MRNPLCEFDRAPLWSSLRRSQCTILWCGFHRVDCIIRIPSWEFHRAGSIVRVPLYKIHVKLYCAVRVVRIPLCAFYYVPSNMCIPSCAFYRVHSIVCIPSYNRPRKEDLKENGWWVHWRFVFTFLSVLLLASTRMHQLVAF